MRKTSIAGNGKKIILLCGPPASGKDTLTELLKKRNNIFCHFKKHRVSNQVDKSGNLKTYFKISLNEFLQRVGKDEFVQFHKRYERFYGVSKKVLDNSLQYGKIPILHVGKIYDLMELEDVLNADAAKILIWETKDVINDRLVLRHHGDYKEIQLRLKSYDTEIESLRRIKLEKAFDFVIKNHNLNRTLNIIEDGVLNSKKQMDLEMELEIFRSYVNDRH